MMKLGKISLALFVCLFYQVGGERMPRKENLCGLIVDSLLEEECLDCFTEAGLISEHPEEVRQCVATYLPPMAADCSVPHPDRMLAEHDFRINQGTPTTHHNHTNANLLPLCLRRRMRALSRYLRRENQFTSQAGKIVKRVTNSRIVPDGGPTMLSIEAVHAIIQIPRVQRLVREHASICIEEYGTDGMQRAFHRELEKENSHLVAHSKRREDKKKSWKKVRDGDDFGLPFRGANSLSQEVLMAECIIRSLIDNGVGMQLMQVLREDTFYFPIPQWWVGPLLRLAQTH